MARALQLSLPARRTWGGRRRGAGRKRTPGSRPSVPHVTRPPHVAAHPVHVTLRCASAVRCLRAGGVFPAVSVALSGASHDGFRVIHFSAQDDHVHLIVEADDTPALRRGVRGLTIRMARAVNAALGRRGAVFGDRYHARALTTPRAVRFALIYVLRNRQKHSASERGPDPCSSALWFDGWREPVPSTAKPTPVVRARTWLASVGWRRHGLIATHECPRAGGRRRRMQRR